MNRNNILIVEDQKIIAKIFSILLEKKGYKVVITSSATDAIAKAKELDPHIILMDIQLNEKSTGIDIARQLRQYGYEKKIIFTTGNLLDNTREQVKDIENCEILIKPVQFSDIEKFI